MIAELQCVVLDCPDPTALAEFYRTVLGGTVNQPDPRWSTDAEWATLHTPTGQVLAFQRALDHVPPRWQDPTSPQQFHLDLQVPDLHAPREQLIAAGAVLLDEHTGGTYWHVYADPAGHPFCLVRH
ncbi:VOC family protein [Streptomyces sp. NPDC004732]|uniref:VOC family protein n=1 Tax=Streptomyces sp. NPDC004732 TaxID=3154290 RepID=UPI0033BB23CB